MPDWILRLPPIVSSATVVFVFSVSVSIAVTCIHRTAAKSYNVDPQRGGIRLLPAGWLLGLLESYFYFAVLCMDGAALLAGGWLAFKVATRWESSKWSKPTKIETRVGYRGFQVGTIGTLLAGITGAAIYRYLTSPPSLWL